MTLRKRCSTCKVPRKKLQKIECERIMIICVLRNSKLESRNIFFLPISISTKQKYVVWPYGYFVLAIFVLFLAWETKFIFDEEPNFRKLWSVITSSRSAHQTTSLYYDDLIEAKKTVQDDLQYFQYFCNWWTLIKKFFSF